MFCNFFWTYFIFEIKVHIFSERCLKFQLANYRTAIFQARTVPTLKLDITVSFGFRQFTDSYSFRQITAF